MTPDSEGLADRSAGNESRLASYLEHLASTWGTRIGGRRSAPTAKGLSFPASARGASRLQPTSRPAGFKARINRGTILSRTPIGCRRPCWGEVRTFVLPRKVRRSKSLDRRRHGIPEEGRSFRWRRVAVLRATRQAGQLSDCSVVVGSQRAREPAGRLSALSSRGLGSRSSSPGQSVFKIKPQIALDQIRAARAEGVSEGVVLADAGYGINTALRSADAHGPTKAWTVARSAPDADAARRAEPASVGQATRQVAAG